MAEHPLTSGSVEPVGNNARRLRVVLVTRKWPPAIGGMERWSVETAEALSHRCELTVLKLPGRADGRPPAPSSLALFLLRMAWVLPRHARDADAILYGDMVLFPLAWWTSLRMGQKRPRQMLKAHGLDVIYQRRPGLAPRLYGWFMAWAKSRQDAVDTFIANSESTGELLHSLDFKQVAVVPLAVRLAASAHPSGYPSRPSPLAPLSTYERFCLFCGRVVPRKGVLWFVENVLPLLPSDIRFVVVGRALNTTVCNRLRDHPRIDYLGCLSDEDFAEKMPQLKARAICSVMPNVNNPDGLDIEGFGLTALELADGGAPVLVADQEGLRDAVRHGENGWRLPPEDAQAWAEKIRELAIWDIEQRVAHERRAHAVLSTHYSWDRVAADYLKLASCSGACESEGTRGRRAS